MQNCPQVGTFYHQKLHTLWWLELLLIGCVDYKWKATGSRVSNSKGYLFEYLQLLEKHEVQVDVSGVLDWSAAGEEGEERGTTTQAAPRPGPASPRLRDGGGSGAPIWGVSRFDGTSRSSIYVLDGGSVVGREVPVIGVSWSDEASRPYCVQSLVATSLQSCVVEGAS